MYLALRRGSFPISCKLQARVSRERDGRGSKETTHPAVTVLRPRPGPAPRVPAAHARGMLSFRLTLLPVCLSDSEHFPGRDRARCWLR